jgi:nucleoid-associated protein YgaU
MEPASMYLAVIFGVFGVWLTGERLWALGSAVVVRWPSGSRRSRAAATAVAALMTFALLRVGSVGAATLPMQERVVLESETRLPPTNEVVLTKFVPITTSGPVESSAESTHTVERGECLWRIARSVLSSSGARPSGAEVGALWRAIYDLNRELIGGNPNLIHPGQVLQIPER